jgi:hypothetical protein
MGVSSLDFGWPENVEELLREKNITADSMEEQLIPQ